MTREEMIDAIAEMPLEERKQLLDALFNTYCFDMDDGDFVCGLELDECTEHDT
jgi:hypothetical protein